MTTLVVTAAASVSAPASTSTAAASSASSAASTTTIAASTMVRVVFLPHLLLNHRPARVFPPIPFTILSPGVVSKLLRHLLQPWDPRGNVLSGRVIILALFNRVELPRTARVVADACDVLPIAPVGVGIVVDEPALEEFGAVLPVPLKILCEEGGDVLAASVGHEAGEDEFGHVGVDEGYACSCSRPPDKRI